VTKWLGWCGSTQKSFSKFSKDSSSQLFTYFVSVIFKSLLSVLHVALKGVGFNPIKRNFNLLIYTNSEKVPVLKAAITDLR
jgi:hypothetical protein